MEIWTITLVQYYPRLRKPTKPLKPHPCDDLGRTAANTKPSHFSEYSENCEANMQWSHPLQIPASQDCRLTPQSDGKQCTSRSDQFLKYWRRWSHPMHPLSLQYSYGVWTKLHFPICKPEISSLWKASLNNTAKQQFYIGQENLVLWCQRFELGN